MKTILLAEDEEALASPLQATLTKAGYKVVRCKNGQEALDWLKDNKPDIFLLDIIMPEKDGWSVMELLKKEDKLDFPVIVMSNLDSTERRQGFLDLGAKKYIVKANESLDSILDSVKEYLR